MRELNKENNGDKIFINNVQTLKFCVLFIYLFFFSANQGIWGILLTVSSLPYVEEELQLKLNFWEMCFGCETLITSWSVLH